MIGFRSFTLAIVAFATAASADPSASPPPQPRPTLASESGGDWGALELLGRRIEPGERSKFAYYPSPNFEQSFMNTAVFVVRGARRGPTLCLSALIHGDERNGFEVARIAFEQTDPARLSGTLIAIPAVNVNGFRNGSRYMADRRDLNREFPGSTGGSNSGLIAHRLHFLATRYCDAVIDLHTGSFERANLPQVRVDLTNPRARDIARAFGAPVVLGGEGPRGSFRRELMESGVLAILYEAGLPLRFEPHEIERGVEGVQNVMHRLGMRDRSASPPTPESRVFARSEWLRVPMGEGGIFYPVLDLGDRIAPGDVLAHIDEPFLDKRFTMHATEAGTVIGMAVPQVVFSGYALVHVATP